MTNLIIFILGAYGFSNIVVYGSNFQWFRNALEKLGTGPLSLYKLFTCMMCLPTWVGFGLSALFQHYGVETPISSLGLDNYWWVLFLDGVLTSGGVYAFNVLVEYFEGD